MGKKRLPAKERRELIIEAALEVFSERGYEGSTVKKIAERAKINQALIYQHFKNKEDLYKSILEKTPSQFLPRKEVDKLMEGKNDREILDRFVHRYLQLMRSNEKIVKFINLGQWENPQVFEFQYFQEEKSPIKILANYLSKRMEEGKFRRKNPRLSARVLIGVIHWYGLRCLIAKARGWKTYEEEEVLDTIIDVYLNGIISKKKAPKKTKKMGKSTV